MIFSVLSFSPSPVYAFFFVPFFGSHKKNEGKKKHTKKAEKKKQKNEGGEKKIDKNEKKREKTEHRRRTM